MSYNISGDKLQFYQLANAVRQDALTRLPGAIDWLMPTSHTGGNSQPELPHVPYHLKTPHPQINYPKSKKYM